VSVIAVVVLLVIVGVCLYLIETYIPMAAPIKLVLRVVVVLVLVLWLLQAFGINPMMPRVR
jgi:hypothetical protein